MANSPKTPKKAPTRRKGSKGSSESEKRAVERYAVRVEVEHAMNKNTSFGDDRRI